jgi:maltooligosyltrehalose trehalohydrolase
MRTADWDRHGPLCHDDGTTTFRVWAPRPDRVDVELRGQRHPLEGRGDGWWQATLPAGHGDDYGVVLDGGAVRPDPATRRQPEGVHGPSRLVDVRRFTWSPDHAQWRPPPLSAAAIYELHIGTFTSAGTFDAAVAQLGALAALGVTHVEVMPVNAFNGEHGWGYDGVDWYAVHEPYGGPEAFARFVDACHRAGLAVVLDVVYNHLGPSGNYLGEFGPYLTDAYSTPWGDALNMDGADSDPVRAFIVGNALQWLRDYRVDALRLDAVHGLVDTSAVHILTELSAAVDALATTTGRDLVLIAESDRADPLTITPRAQNGQGMDAQWADDLHHAIHSAVTGEHDGYYVDYAGLPDVGAAYELGFLFDGRYSVHRRKTVGAPLGGRSAHHLVGHIQNHDQVGNRATGDRLTTLVEPALVRVAALLLCAAPHVPMLFMGEEYGETNPFQYFTSHPEPELGEAVRSGRREEFAGFTSFTGDEVPDPQDAATRDRSVLDWTRAQSEEGRARRRLWSDLLAARRGYGALGNGRRDLVEVAAADRDVLAVVRRDPLGPPVLLVANVGEDHVSIAVPPGAWQLILSTDDAAYGGARGAVTADDGQATIPGGAAVLWAGTRY